LEEANPLKRGLDTTNMHAESDEEESSDDEVLLTENCDQIRRKINTFIDNGGMTVKDFVAALKITSVGYYRFMKQYGKDKGSYSDTFVQATRFFQKRAAQGLPMPKKKRKITAPTTSKSAATNPVPAAASLDIQLGGESDDAVPIYDSCDEIRRKINAHLRKPDVTQSQFLRDLHAQFQGPRRPTSLQSAQLSRFRSQKGPVTGNTSGIYYAAYLFFEKQRLAAGKPKSKHREDMEDAWAWQGGVDVKRNLNNCGLLTAVGRQTLRMNELGLMRPY
jgi:hypothetical protein